MNKEFKFSNQDKQPVKKPTFKETWDNRSTEQEYVLRRTLAVGLVALSAVGIGSKIYEHAHKPEEIQQSSITEAELEENSDGTYQKYDLKTISITEDGKHSETVRFQDTVPVYAEVESDDISPAQVPIYIKETDLIGKGLLSHKTEKKLEKTDGDIVEIQGGKISGNTADGSNIITIIDNQTQQ